MTARVIVIGLDGLEPTLVQRWIDSGDMPAIGRLRERARWGALRSTLPCATFPAWTSLMTGVNPGEHGVFDFARLIKGSYDVAFDGALARRRPTLQRLVSDAGMRVASIGFPGTWPPEPINGVVISGFDSPVAVGIDDSFVHPPELAAELRSRFGRYVFADFAETHTWLPGWHRRAADKLARGLERRLALADHLLGREPWDLFMVHFGESDTAGHHFWAFHDPASPRRPTSVAADLEGVLRGIYVALDRAVARLVERAGEGAAVLLASDHGFGGSSAKVLHLNRWLAEQGHLRFNPRPGLTQRATALGIKAGMALAPGRLQERLWRLARPLAGRAEARRRFGGIDWGGTLAYSEELSYHPSIRLNVQGREPMGRLAPREVGPFTDRLIEALEALRDPWSGRPVVARAWRREALYQGAAVDQAPEVVLDLALDGQYTYNCLSSQGPGPAWRWLSAGERLGAKGAGMNGTHRREGFWLLSGEGSAPRRKRAEMVDMAPTVLAALGLAAPSWLEGCSQWRLQPDARPLGDVEATRAARGGYTPAQQAIVEARLRKLGYI